MANDDFFAALDEAEARIETKAGKPKKVRYWYEEGYVPGNEKDSDEESTSSESAPERVLREAEVDDAAREVDDAAREEDHKVEQVEEQKPPHAAAAEPDSETSDHYEEVVPRSRGGRHVRWGGLDGKLCLADAAAHEFGVPPLGELLDELLLPMTPSVLAVASGSSDAGDAAKAQILQDCGMQQRYWSHGAILSKTDLSSVTMDMEEVHKKYADIEDAEGQGQQARSMEEPHAQHLAFGSNLGLRKQEDREAGPVAGSVSSATSSLHSSAIVAVNRLPGTRRPLAVTQAWQSQKAMTEAAMTRETGDAASTVGRRAAGAFSAAAAARRAAKPKLMQPTPRRSMAMLPGSLSSGSSSSARPKPLPVGGPEVKIRGMRTGEAVHLGPPIEEWPQSAGQGSSSGSSWHPWRGADGEGRLFQSERPWDPREQQQKSP